MGTEASTSNWSRRELLTAGGVAALAGASLGSLLLAPSAAGAPGTPDFGPAIDPYPTFQGQTTCDPTPKPGVTGFRSVVLSHYTTTGDLGISRACNVGGTSEHKEGRAWDWAVNASTQGAIANDLLNWLLATDRHGNRHALARRFGIMYIIWNRRFFALYNVNQGWVPYTGPNPHTDHVHFSFTWAGARRQTSWWTADAVPRINLVGDWNGNGTPDVGVYRPSTNQWLVPNFLDARWGGAGDVPVAGMWNGTGRTFQGVWRPSDGTWRIPGTDVHSWGGNGDIPVPADYNGDGDTDIAVFRPSQRRFLIPGITTTAFPTLSPDAIPVPADWNGDRKAEPAVFDRGKWYLPGGRVENWGGAGDIPVPGDWNGDGRANVAVWRAGVWLIPGVANHTWGGTGDIPIPMNWHGGTRVFMTVFRPSSGEWLTPGRTTVRWGGRGDIPITANGNTAVWRQLGYWS